MTRRLFVAVDLDGAARERVGAISAGLQSQMSTVTQRRTRVTWVAQDRLHLTLHFIGNVDDGRADCLTSALARPLATAPLGIELDTLGVFPGRGRSRVIWIGVGRGADGLRRLHQQAGERLTSCGCALEPRPLTPHLTLGRVREGALGDVPLPRVDPPVQSAVTHVTLYESQLSSRGPAYTALARASLTGQGN